MNFEDKNLTDIKLLLYLLHSEHVVFIRKNFQKISTHSLKPVGYKDKDPIFSVLLRGN